MILPILPVRSKWARKNSGFALSKTTTRRLEFASMRASKSCKAWYSVASTMLKGGSSNTIRQSTGDLHRPIQRLTAYALVDKAEPCCFLRVDGITHEDVHESRRRPNGARQPLRAAGPRDKSQVGLRQSDQVVTFLSDAKIAGKRELECASQTRSGNGGDNWLWHALAQCHGLIEKSCVVGRVVGPFAAGSAKGLGEL